MLDVFSRYVVGWMVAHCGRRPIVNARIGPT
jgi:transposase InsO family protein